MARFTRTRPAPEVKGTTYGRFRPHIRHDFEQCCAFCLFHEHWARGRDMFQIDHFRPQDKFPGLINDFHNLYYACYACNHKKSNHWPTEEQQAQGITFVDLCHDDFQTHYQIEPNGRLIGKTEAAQYTIDTLRLNSEDLVTFRAWAIAQGYSIDKSPL